MASMAKRNPFLVFGFLAVLVGIVLLFVPPIGDPAQEPGFAAYWWLAAPVLIIGLVLLAVGWRRYQLTKGPKGQMEARP